jgi:hypothetical protein
MPATPTIIRSTPGIKRDGTVFQGDHYVDGQWCRFQRGYPRKMGGYRRATNQLAALARGMHAFSENGQTYVHVGEQARVEQVIVDNQAVASPVANRTPAGFVSNAAHLWQFDVLFDTVTGNQKLIAHAGLNLVNQDETTNKPIYVGDMTGTGALVAAGGSAPQVSGGVVVLHPYVFAYGTDGYVAWSVAGNPNDWASSGSGDGYVTGQKIVKGLPLRAGPGNSPSGIFWSLDSVIRATFVGGAPVFQFDTVSATSSILSSQGVIEYDGVYYWAGVDRFLMFNGVVREVPNPLNLNWFFDNLNFEQRQKVFAMAVPRYGEIWWCFPFGNETECTHAVIYNVREQTWYDTVLPNAGRSGGIFVNVSAKPLMVGSSSTTATQNLWQHETGFDEIDGISINAIRSYFETADIALPALPKDATNKAIRLSIIEPDFVQRGDMTVRVTGRYNARSPAVPSEARPFPAIATDPSEQVVFLKEIRRELRLIFESNAIGGDYQMGQVIAHLEPADARILS